MVAFSTFMIKRFPFLWKSNSFSSRGQRNALRSPSYRRLVTHIQRRAPLVCAQGQTKNIIYVRYTGIFFSFLAQLLSVLLQSIFHILSENCVIFSEYLNICTGVKKTDQATICSKSPLTAVQHPCNYPF